jgi:hypothetical protein
MYLAHERDAIGFSSFRFATRQVVDIAVMWAHEEQLAAMGV